MLTTYTILIVVRTSLWLTQQTKSQSLPSHSFDLFPSYPITPLFQVYRYGYLWSVHSLYNWWRDQGRAEEGSLQSELSPCYLNRMDVTEVAVGWGKYTLELLRSLINRFSPFRTGYPLELVNCFAPPPKEYIFPKDLYPYFD